jgi:hypothetical protein
MRVRESEVRRVISQTLREMALGHYVSNVPTETPDERNLYPSKKGYKAMVVKQLEKFPLKVNVMFDTYSGEKWSSGGVATNVGIKNYTPGADQGERIVMPGNRIDDLVSIDSEAGRAFSSHLFNETGERPGPEDFNILRLGTAADFSARYGPNASAYMAFHELFDGGPFNPYGLRLQNILYRYLKAIAPTIGEDISARRPRLGETSDNPRKRKSVALIDELISLTGSDFDDQTISEMSVVLGQDHPWTFEIVRDHLMGPNVKTIRNKGVEEGDLREACHEALVVSLLKQTDPIRDYNPAQDPDVQSILGEMHMIMTEVPGLAANLAGELYVGG